ncbi:YbbN family protein [Microbulbifer hainanensis]|uniref:thioredoxin family protein n=1 Tax=Microbulbifer hainanensis TaxID=2735675 RepID=UPI001867051F|nr:thioredoxin family protein [Microbulbifer hainanensis]
MLSLASPALSAAELLYIFEPHCAPCRAFDHDIGGIYSKTEEAHIAPLRRVNINTIHGKHVVLGNRQVDVNTDIIGAPTFILISDGREIDRFSGYSQDELFWMSLQRLLNRLPSS